VSRPADFRSIEGILRRHLLHNKSKVIPDAEAALLGGTSRGVGIVVISGTGSVVFGRNRAGKTKKVSGHGHLIGDPGSGYDLGIRALRAILASAEGRVGKTKLTWNVLRAIPLGSEDEVVPWLYSQPDVKQVVARLAPTVIATAVQEHDPVAGEILRSATEELAGLVAFTARYLDLAEQPFDVVLSGGVFLNNPAYFSLMQSSLSAKISTANPIRPENDPAFGALVSLLGRPASSRKEGDENPFAPGVR
jgi:N-acetylglucosamine kinase-like BadF-type ATPase